MSLLTASCAGGGEQTSAGRQAVWFDPDPDVNDHAPFPPGPNERYPGIVRISINHGSSSSTCTAWLAGTNRLVTAGHCFNAVTDAVTVMRLDSAVSRALEDQLASGSATGGALRTFTTQWAPGWPGCVSDDVAVITFDPPLPENFSVRPMALIEPGGAFNCKSIGGGSTEECLMVLGVGRTDEPDGCYDAGGPQSKEVRGVRVESDYTKDSCDVDVAAYDFDDSQPCGGDSGGPIVERTTDKVVALMHGPGDPGEGDDVTGPVFWRDGPSTARAFLALTATDPDSDGIQSRDDNCDLVANPAQGDWNADGIGDACQDSDNDGLTDEREIQVHHTNPGSADTDGDGLSDGREVNETLTNPLVADTDGDGLKDGEEVLTYHTSPLDPDTDDDGLMDGPEILLHHTNPLVADTDGDGLSDGAEVSTQHTDPLKPDTDGDGLTDGQEVLTYHTNPLDADTDDDGLTDGQEVLTYHTNPLDADTDDDGLTDGQEVQFGLNPLNPDTDGDGLIDGKDVDFVRIAIERLPDSVVHPSRNPIINHLLQAERKARVGDVAGAIERLENLRRHLDGCGQVPGNDDWIVSCPEQTAIRGLIDLLITNLGA